MGRAAAEVAVTVDLVDDRGQRLSWPSPPARIVSLVPSDTYTLVRLGFARRLVGRTRYCVDPREPLSDVPTVGGVLDPDVAHIIQLRPEVVVANQEDNRLQDVQQLETAGVPVLVSHPTTLDAGLAHARRISRLCQGSVGPEPPALARAAAAVAALAAPEEPPLRVFVPVWLEPLVAVGPGSFADDLLRHLGLTNVTSTLVEPSDLSAGAAYPRLDPAAVAAAQPEILLLPDEPYEFSEAEGAQLQQALAAGRHGERPRVLRCRGKDLFWYGLGALEGLPRLSRLLALARGQLSTPPRG